jgi:predicted unusual protein kinase regulating ubiquinone biosynthesis (AarF/ABC1/UbiB family)
MHLFNKTHNNSISHQSTLKIWKFGTEFQIRYNFQKDRNKLGIWMRDELIQLGPAFIKIGQFMSTRVDIFGKEVTNQLSELQDQIDPVDFTYMKQVLEDEIPNYNTLFTDIEPIAIASASIGQVYKGVLKKSNQPIALKIQKPDIEYKIKTDLQSLMYVNKLFASLGFQQAKDFDAILQQYEQFLAGELNYMNEARYMLFFRNRLKNNNIYIPKPLVQSTSRVLVMEYVESIKITDITKLKELQIDTTNIAKELIEVFLYQIIYLGKVHCDPHPGNIGIHQDGRIVLYDFGNVVELNSSFREKINNLIFAIYQKDIDEFLDILLQLNIIQLEDELDALELKVFFNYFFSYLESLNFDELKNAILNKDISYNTNIKVKIDPNFLCLFRVFSLLDGTCTLLDPNFNYITSLAPFSNNILMDRDFISYRIKTDVQKLTSYPRLLKSTDQNILRVNRRFIKLSDQIVNTRYLVIAIAVLNNIDDPLLLCILLSITGLFFWKEE